MNTMRKKRQAMLMLRAHLLKSRRVKVLEKKARSMRDTEVAEVTEVVAVAIVEDTNSKSITLMRRASLSSRTKKIHTTLQEDIEGLLAATIVAEVNTAVENTVEVSTTEASTVEESTVAESTAAEEEISEEAAPTSHGLVTRNAIIETRERLGRMIKLLEHGMIVFLNRSPLPKQLLPSEYAARRRSECDAAVC